MTLTPTPTPTAVPTVCTLAADSYEPDNTPAAASDFDLANLTSGSRTFSSLTDADWMRFTANAGRLYTFSADLVGWSGGVTLSIFDPDGTTLKVVGQNQIAFTPTTGGQYFLRAQSSAGITIPCSASYSVGLVITNPNATPVPTPVGTPLPPGHDKPPLSAAVLAPADSAVVTQLQPINVDVGLNADNNIQSAAFLVDGVSVDSYSAPPDTGDATWATTWTPAQSGVYSLTAEITDSLNATAASSANVVYVDLAGPSVSIAAGDITLADLESDGTYLLQGTATDDSQVDTVEVRLDGGPWQEAQLDGTNWSFTLAPLAQASPDGGSLAIDARVTDVAAQTATDSATVVLDVVAPDIFTATTSLVSGAVITPGMVISDLNARLAWTAVPGAASVYAGWTSSPTPSLGALTAFPPSAGTLDQTILQGSTRYAHVVAVDSHGNQTAVTRGPFFFDSAETPDLITNLAVQDWVNSGGKQVGQMATDVHGVQKLFAGWNATTLRLRWQGLNVNSDGDLYLYLGTGGPGSTDLYNPYGPSEPAVLPFAADYLVRVSGGVTPTLLAYAGGAWVQQTEVAALSTGDLNDVLLPFADLGIAAPAAASLKLLGVASQQGALDVWATVPDRNLGRPWKQYAQFLSLGAGIVPADGVWADAPLEVVVSPDPSPAKPAGPGEVINVNVRATNGGSATLPSLTVYGATTGGVSLTSPPQVATSIAPSTTASLDLSGVVASDGTLTVTLADSYHRTYRLETLAYTVDNTPPISVSLAVTYLVPLANTVLGTAVDDSPLDLFQMEVTSGAGTQVVSCDETGLTAGGYACLLDAGNAADGAIFTLRARATDIHGNISGWSTPVQVEVDATPPVLALSPPTLTAFSDGWINRREQVLTGALTDERGVARVVLCSQDQDVPCVVQRVLSDNSWAAPVPVVGDGIAVTLVFTGFDVAGNASTPLVDSAAAIPVIVDTVAPDLGPTTLTDGVSINNTPVQLGSGTVTDGGGVAGVQVYIVRPDGSSASVAGTVSGQDWWAHFVFDQAGDYQILVVATDIAGNKASQFAGLLTVTAVPTAVTLADFSAVQQGALVRLTWETSMELDNQGFNLYRGTSATGPDRQLNDVLIPSQSPGSSTGFVYIWDDGADLTPGTTYFYWVEDVDLSGTATRHGPVSVDYTTPTAVRLSGLAAAGAPRGGAPGVGVMLLVVMLAGAVALHRRRKLHPF
ncbi:MAG: Ig-like domain-containing protein [Caldilineales bacterium]